MERRWRSHPSDAGNRPGLVGLWFHLSELPKGTRRQRPDRDRQPFQPRPGDARRLSQAAAVPHDRASSERRRGDLAAVGGGGFRRDPGRRRQLGRPRQRFARTCSAATEARFRISNIHSGRRPAGSYPHLKHVPAKWNPVRRPGHASTLESTAFPVHMGSPSDPI